MPQLPTFALLQADGSTASGCWILAGCWTQAEACTGCRTYLKLFLLARPGASVSPRPHPV